MTIILQDIYFYILIVFVSIKLVDFILKVGRGFVTKNPGGVCELVTPDEA